MPRGGEMFQPPILVPAAGTPAQEAERGILFPLKGELTGVVKHQNLLVRLREPPTGGLEMTGHDLVLAHPVIGEKAVSRLGVGPILTGIRNTFADSLGHHPQQLTEPFGQPHILKIAPAHFCINPSAGVRVFGDGLRLRARFIGSHPNYPPQLSKFVHLIRNKSSPSTKYLWVIESVMTRLQMPKLQGLSQVGKSSVQHNRLLSVRFFQGKRLAKQPKSCQVLRRKILWMAAWSVGFTINSSMLTCGGRAATQTMISAMSSAVSGSMPS